MATVDYHDEDFKANVQAALEDAVDVDVNSTEIESAVEQALETSAGTVTESQTFAGLTSGQDTVATAGTAEALNGGTSLAVPDGATIKIRALGANTGNVYVGDSSVSSANGYELDPGEKVELAVDDVASVYIDVDTGGEGASWVVEQ